MRDIALTQAEGRRIERALNDAQNAPAKRCTACGWWHAGRGERCEECIEFDLHAEDFAK